MFVTFDPEGSLDKGISSFFSSKNLKIELGQQFEKPRLYRFGNKVLFILGYPIVEGRIDDGMLVERLKANNRILESLDNFDGSFLIFY